MSVTLAMNYKEVFAAAVVEKIEVIRDFYYENYPPQDQTLHPCIESCIEIILRKL